MDVAVTAKRLGAKKVTLACVEPRDRMPASSEEIERAEAEGVVVMPSWGLSRVFEEDDVVSGMELKRCTSVWDENGVYSPQYDENDKLVVKAHNILLAIGQRVDLSFLGEKYHIQMTERGLIDVDADTQMTSRKGVFAAGDATTGPATVVESIKNGRKAAEGLNGYLGVAVEKAECGCDCGHPVTTSDNEGLASKVSLKLHELDADKRNLDLEDSQTPSDEEAICEAKRCLNCACYAVHPSDTAPALIALNAEIVTNKRTLCAEGLFEANTLSNTVLDFDEVITEIRIPKLPDGAKSIFKKMALRKSIDFPIVNCAIVTGPEPRVCLNAVSPVPKRMRGAEDVLRGKAINEEVATAAGEAAVDGTSPFVASKYKVQIAKTLVKRALLELGE